MFRWVFHFGRTPFFPHPMGEQPLVQETYCAPCHFNSLSVAIKAWSPRVNFLRLRSSSFPIPKQSILSHTGQSGRRCAGDSSAPPQLLHWRKFTKPTQYVGLFSVQCPVELFVSNHSLGLVIKTVLPRLCWYGCIARILEGLIPVGPFQRKQCLAVAIDATIGTPTHRFWTCKWSFTGYLG